MKKEDKYFIANFMIDKMKLSSYELLLYAWIYNYNHHHGSFNGNVVKEIGSRVGLSIQALKKYLNLLKEKKLIEYDKLVNENITDLSITKNKLADDYEIARKSRNTFWIEPFMYMTLQNMHLILFAFLHNRTKKYKVFVGEMQEIAEIFNTSIASVNIILANLQEKKIVKREKIQICSQKIWHTVTNTHVMKKALKKQAELEKEE